MRFINPRCVFFVSFIGILITFIFFNGIQTQIQVVIGKRGRPAKGEHGVGRELSVGLTYRTTTIDEVKSQTDKQSEAANNRTYFPSAHHDNGRLAETRSHGQLYDTHGKSNTREQLIGIHITSDTHAQPDAHEQLVIPVKQGSHDQQGTHGQASVGLHEPQDTPIKPKDPQRQPASDADLQKHIEPVHNHEHHGIRETHRQPPVRSATHPANGRAEQQFHCSKLPSFFPGREPFKTTREGNLISSINEEDRKKYATWLLEQVRRKQRVKEVCKQHTTSAGLARESSLKDVYSHLLVDDKHKVLYCYIPKAACTSWRSMLLTLTGHFDPSHPEVFRQCVHDHDFTSKHGLKTLSMFTPNDVKQRLITYTKFMAVRDPIKRLLSAFQNKFRQFDAGALPFHDNFGKLMIERYRDNPSNESLRTGENVTLSEFFRFVTDANIPWGKRAESHWMPFQNLCHPCLIDYDYIATVETLEEDSNFILDRVFHTDFRLQSLQATERTDTRLLDSIPADILNEVYRHFDVDYKMFGYT